jgi:hypothetical protein
MGKYTALLAVMACFACAGGDTAPEPVPAEIMAPAVADYGSAVSLTAKTLEEFAEMERSGGYVRGMGLVESGMREEAGDYAGAVLAAYKELAWAYGYGLAEKTALEKGLGKVLAMEGEAGEEKAVRAAGGILAFIQGRWAEAEEMLAPLFGEDEAPDSFARWMILVCGLEKDPRPGTAGAAYGAIRARYAAFPEYWYRGARFFSENIAAEYAEQCISLAPSGPFAGECREILAVQTGLDPREGKSLRSRGEIERIISQSVSQNNPELLSNLLPLIGLPDNPYTVYAVGALRALAGAPQFGDYFAELAGAASGRLAERLVYIRGGRG